MSTSSRSGVVVLRSVAAWLLGAAVATCAHADADSARNAGAAWLIKQQQGDGSWANASGDLEVQATSAAIMALKNAGQSRSPTFRAAVSWLSNADSDSIDSISRKIEALSAAGQTSTAQKESTRLYGLRSDSRVAAWSGYGAVNVFDVVDTALGLGALRVGDAAYRTKIYVDATVRVTLCGIFAQRVLLSAGKQAWPLSFSSAGQSAGQGRPSVVATALLVSELRAIEKTTALKGGSCSSTAGTTTYTLADIQAQAVAWLLDQQNADGGFGEQRTDGSKGGSSALTTALVYKALVNQAAPSSTQVNAALNWLLDKQSIATGSWDGDAFVTATVVSSLASANGIQLVDADKDGLTDRVETQLGSNTSVADARSQLDAPSRSVAGSTTSAFSVNATVGQAFSHGLGGAGNYSLASGTLPPGLLLNASTGQITGTPSQAGSYSFEYQTAVNGDQVIGRIDVAEVVPATDGDVPVPLWALLTLGASLMAAAHRKARLPEAGVALKGLLGWLPALFLAAQSLAPADAQAGQSALSTLIPDQTAQRLREGLSTTESSSRQAMHRATRQKLKELDDELGASAKSVNPGARDSVNPASNDADPAATGLSRRAVQHRADIQSLRQQQLQELRALKDQVQQMAGSEKAAEVQALITQVTARFDRLDAALAKVGAAQSRRDTRQANTELEALLRTLRQPESTVSQAPVPTLMRAPPELREPGKGSISKVLPQYALQMMDEYRAAHKGQPKRPGADEGDQVVAADLGGMAAQGYGFIKAAMSLPAVSPNAASDCSTTAADLADDGVEVQLTPEIRALAQSLQYSPVRILKWMLKEVEFEPYWGSLKGAKGVLQTRRGNATDQSSLLVALLRASNVPARFVRGTVSLGDLQPADSANGRAQRWLGTQNYSASIRYLSSNQGIPAHPMELSIGAATQGVVIDHVWVQACVPFAAYRGNLANSGGHRWLPLDPSIKDHDYQAGMAVNVNTDSSFYAAYLAKRTDQLPPDYLADKTEAAARLTKPDVSREDVPYRGPLRAPKIDILPSTTPFDVVSFSNWPGSASPESATIPDAHRHKFTVAVQSAAGVNLATKTFSLPQNVLSKITVSYAPDTASQALWNSWGGALSALPAGAVNVYPQVKADGVLAASGTATLGLGSTHKVVMKIAQGEKTGGKCIADSGVPTDAKDADATCINKTVYTNLKAGGYFALGFNASQVSDASLASQAQSLITGVNTNATAPTPASAAAYDATVGQLLHLVLQNYIQGITLADEQIAELKGFRSNKRYDLGLTGSQIKTDYVFDLPLTVKPAGVYVDFRGGRIDFTKLASAAPTQLNAGETAASFSERRASVARAESVGMGKLSIYASSALEHRVWQEALRTDAVSTVRGLQFANESGNALVTFTSANIGQYASLMQMSGATSMAANETAIRNEVNAGATVTVPKAQIAYTDPVDTAKAWRGYVYMSENDTSGAYGAAIDGDLAGGFPLFSFEPITFVFSQPPAAPSFQSTINSGLGLLTTLTPGTQGSNSFATWMGDPVNMLTGNFTHHESDLKIKGRGGLPILLERWYNSGEPKDGPLGFGWTHSFNHALKLYGVEGSPGAAKVSWINGSGGEQYFSTTSHSSGDIARGAVLTNPAGVEAQFSRISGGANDGKFQIRERDGTVYLFASATGPNVAPSANSAVVARLLSITDRNGNALTLSYNPSNQLSTVTDSIGRTVLTFTWSGSRIIQVTDLAGRKVTYAYTDGNNNLNQVTDALNQAHRYSYYTAADGTKLANHLKRHTLPRGNGMEFAYYSGGQVFKHTPFGVDGSLIPESATTFHYNLFNRESWSVNGRGEEHHITFDSYGNPQRIVEENGAIHTYTYDSANPYNRLTETDSIGRTTKYTYTAGNATTPKNLVETVTAPSGAVSEYRDYNSFAQPQRIKDVRGNWTWQKFDAAGNQTDSIRLKSGVTPVAGTQPAAADIVAWTRQSFDSAGNVATRTQVSDFSAAAAGSTNVGPSLTHNWDANKLNISSITRKGKRNGTSAAASITETSPTFTYDTLGRQLSGIDGNWYPSNQTWDSLGRITSATDSLGKTRKFVYDANGNPTASELMDGGARVDASSSRFDGQDRLIGTLDYAGNRSFFSYDAVGNRTAQTSPDNYTLSFEYDAANRPVAAFDAEENRVYTQLDTQGRTLSVTDPNGNSVSYQYWGSSTGSAGTYAADGRLKRVTQPAISGQAAGRATEYDYDAAGNVIRTRAVAADGSSSRQSHSFYDELGRVTRSVGAPDDAGNRLQVCSKFDTLGNLAEVWAGPSTDTTASTCNFSDASLKRQVAYTWDDFGNQLSRTDPLGKTWAYSYDSHGNLSSSQSPEQAKVSATTTTTYTYEPNLNGVLKSRTVPGAGNTGQTATYNHNALGQVTRADTRDGSGALLVAYDYSYDTAHRLSGITDSRGNKALGYEWTPGGRLAKVKLKDNATTTATTTHQWDYIYDAVGRLSAIVAPNGQTVTFGFDAAGRLIERSLGAGLSTQYNWQPEGSLDSIVHLAQAGVSATYVGNAQTAQLARHAYTYDIWGNRSASTDTLAGSTVNKAYSYDALNRLKTVSNGTAAQQEGYGFDIFGNLSSKTLGSPATQSWSHTVDDAHQLKQVQQTVGGTTTTALLRYDDNGNLKKLCEGTSISGTATDCSGSQATTYSWSGLNELVTLARAGTNALNEAYAYDDAGKRIRKTSAGSNTHYLYDGQDIAAEWATGASTSLTGAPSAVYAHGTGTDDPVLRLTGPSGTPDATSTAYAQDGIGSVTALLEMDSAPANQMGADARVFFIMSGSYDASTYKPADLADGVTSQTGNSGWVGVVDGGAAADLYLSSTRTLERIEIWAVSNYKPSSYVVEVLSGGSWVQVASGTNADFGPYDGTTSRAIKSFPATSAIGARVRFTGAVNSGLVWLTELQVWSTNGSSTQSFDAWGNAAGSTGSAIPTYGFAGREPDASGLVAMRARYYHPAYGRFISRDPMGLGSGISPYQYADGNPISFNDPTGLIARSVTNTASNYFGGTGSFAPTTSNNVTLGSALADTGRAIANIGISVFEAVGNAGKVPLYGQPAYTSLPRLQYDTPAFGATLGALLPIGAANAVSRMGAGASFADTVGGAAAANGEATVYRVFGGDARAQGFSWTTKDPRTVSNFRDAAGLPSGGPSGATNTADFLIQGRVNTTDIIKSRSALPLDGNKGGLPELIIDPKNVRITDFSILNP